MANSRIPQHLIGTAKYIRIEYCNWLDRISTLGELVAVLKDIREEFLYFDWFALISDHLDELAITADYIDLWDDPSKPDFGPPVPHTFSYRMGLVEDDIDHVTHLIRGLGESFRLSDLPMPKDWQESAAV